LRFKKVQKMANATLVMGLGGDYDPTRAAALYAILSAIGGVEFVEFNYTNNKVTISFDPDRVSLSELTDILSREKEQNPISNDKIEVAGEGFQDGDDS
jgi:allophanate hydrolase subunit 1